MATGVGRGGSGRARPLRLGSRRKPRVWRIALLVVVAVVVAAIVAAAAEVLGRRQPGEGVTTSVATAILGSQPTNVLLIGNNARDATSPLSQGQADLMFLVHVDPVKHEVVFVSIPRDMMVAYPGWNDPTPKIKSAFFMGGPQLAMKTVSHVLGLPVQAYVVADFKGFAAAINAVGGLNIDIQYPIYDPIHSHAVFKAGMQHLNGTEVLAYIRVRQNQAGDGYRVNDFQRMSAAYGIMSSLKHQVLDHLSPGEISRLLGIWENDADTNLSRTELAALAASSLHARFIHVTLGSTRDSMVLPSTALNGVNAENAIQGAYYDVVPNREIAAKLAPYGAAHPSTGIPSLPAPDTVHVEVASTGLASQLRAAGFQVQTASVGTAVGATRILYPAGDLSAAEAVARAVGQGTEVLTPSNQVTAVTVQAVG